MVLPMLPNRPPPGVPPGPLPGMGPPPGMMPGGPPMGPPMAPPMGPPPDQMMPPPGPPPGPPEPQLPELSPAQRILLMLRAAIEEDGEEAVAERLRTLPEPIIDLFWQLSADEPDLADLLTALLPDEPARPEYEPWFEPPPKPTEGQILDLASEDEGFYLDFREEARINLAYFHAPGDGGLFGAFKNFDREKEQPWVSSAATTEVNLIKNQIAAAELTYEVPYTDPSREDDTQAVEDALYAWDAEEDRLYRRRFAGSLRHDETFCLLVLGMVAWRTGLKPSRPSHPFDDALLDPTTVFPAWDEEGLCRVTRSYEDSVAGIISCYDDKGQGVKKKILAATNNKPEGGKEARPYRIGDRVRCTTYHDRWWYAVFVDGICVLGPVAHRYGFVPYVIARSSLSEPMFLGEVQPAASSRTGVAYGSQRRLRYKFVSHFHYMKKALEQREAWGQKLYQLMSNIDKPDYWMAQDPAAEASGTPQVRTGGAGGNVNPIKMNQEQPIPMVMSPNAPLIMQPFAALMGQDFQTGFSPLAAHGIFESANQSGNATEGAVEAGGDKRQPHLDALEAFRAAKQEMRLALWQNFGHEVETGEDSYGELTVPTSAWRQTFERAPRSVKLTPETIKRTGTVVNASLRHVRLQNLAALGNAVAVWMSNGIMSPFEAMNLRNARDPMRVFHEINFAKILMDPDLARADAIEQLRQRNPAMAETYEKLIAGKQQQQMGPPGMMPGGPPPGMMPGMGAGPMAPNTSAMNLPALGLGQQGPTGRPPGSMGPPGGAPPTDFRP